MQEAKIFCGEETASKPYHYQLQSCDCSLLALSPKLLTSSRPELTNASLSRLEGSKGHIKKLSKPKSSEP